MNLSKIFVNNTQIVSVDDEPTSGSDNLVKSGGVFSSISDLSTYIEGGEVQQVNFEVSKYIAINGVYADATIVYKATEEYIEVLPNRTYESNCVYDSYNCTAFYDEDKNFLSYTQKGTFKIPSNCKYIRLSSIGTDISFRLLELSLKEQIQNISVDLSQERERISTINTYIHDNKEYISKYLSRADRGIISDNGKAYINNIDGKKSICLIPIKRE